jgi:AraC-like DNA-binding protein
MAVEGGAALGGASSRMLIACRLLGEDPFVFALLEAMEAELAAGRVGAASVVDRLANVVGATAIRSWAESGCPVAGEWLTPLRDPHLGKAIAAIHRDPGSAWTVASLARVAQASRSSFADRFASAVGEPPARYVVRVRMQRAMQLLRRDDLTVAQTAERLGYSSDAAFSRAFRRFSGHSPRDWRRQAA